MFANIQKSMCGKQEKYIKTHSNHFRGVNRRKGYRYKPDAADEFKQSRVGCDFVCTQYSGISSLFSEAGNRK